MALLAALTAFVPATQGFTHPTLRPLVADLMAGDADHDTTGQLTYDLRRLRLKGILWRVPKTQHYPLTPYGRKVALFCTRLHARVFRPGLAALDPTVPIPGPLAEALAIVEQEIDHLIDDAYLASSA